MCSPDEKERRLAEVAPHIWAMYLHVFEARSKLENKLSFFLAITGIMLAGVLQLFTGDLTTLPVVIPLLLLALPVLLLLVNFLAAPPKNPWIELQPLLMALEKRTFTREWIAEIFASAYATHDYMKRTVKLLKCCWASVAISLTWLAVIFLTYLCRSPKPDYETAIIFFITLITMIAVGFVASSSLRKYPFEERINEVQAVLKAWVNEPPADGGVPTA